uniref:Odorant receptor n=1 Tax=Campoletis chlorideae TaxID=219166 RepID=A0A346D482_9HYME|nr:odorant receptor [Campoletis chlorideae]
MAKNVTEVKNVVKLIRIFGRLTSTWPSDPDSTRNVKIRDEVIWWVCFINATSLVVPLILGAYHYRYEITVLMKTMSELTALSEVFFNLIICKFQRSRLQALLSKVEKDVMNANVEDELIYQKYVDRYLHCCMAIGSLFFLAAMTFSCGPLVMDINLPADAWYPFPIDLPIVRYSVYLTQILAILQTGICVTVDITVLMMLGYISAGIEILAGRLERVIDDSDLGQCIIEHQRIIK